MIKIKNIKIKVTILSYLQHYVFSFPDDENCDCDLFKLSILVTVAFFGKCLLPGLGRKHCLAWLYVIIHLVRKAFNGSSIQSLTI